MDKYTEAKHRRIANESNAAKGFDDSDVSNGMRMPFEDSTRGM